MKTRFANRAEAGRELAGMLERYAGRGDVVVLALPRGGVPVGREIASRIGAPLDVMVVRKLGVPWQEELAMGAIASGGFRVVNPDVIANAGVTRVTLEETTKYEERELARREQVFRAGRPAAELKGRVVILVDDGIATGATMRVAARAVRHAGPAELIVAVPVAPPDTLRELSAEADDVVACLAPERLSSIGEWYDDFAQLTDAEVQALLDAK